MTPTQEAAMRQALEALEEIADEVFSPYDNRLGAAILALRATLETQATHSTECYKWHHECAVAEVERLRAALGSEVSGRDEAPCG